MMNRKEIYRDIQETLGLIPSMFKVIPDSTLETEWHLFKEIEWDQGEIPHKYRELIGLALSASRGCPYTTYLHTELAKLYGASDAEIEDAVHFAKLSVGWSTYITGLQMDMEQFKRDVREACERIKSSAHLQVLQRRMLAGKESA
ncbi:MAG: carboxymuconolactone decarboxylase family protein [Endomicrobiales bacterium]